MSSRLEGAVHGDHEGVLSEGQDVSLHKGLLDLIPQHQVLFVDLLHGKTLLGLLMAHQIHSPVREREREAESERSQYVRHVAKAKLNQPYITLSDRE